MFWKFLESIPVVGHVKGLAHYVTGDFGKGNIAFFEATRSAVVMVGGAAGVVAGPVGVAAGAVAAGMVADVFATGATGTPTGVFAGISGIVTGVANGEAPVESLVNLGLCVAGDAIGGFGGVSLGNSTVKAASEAVGKNIGKEVILKTVIKKEAKLVIRATVTYSVARMVVLNDNESQRNTYKQSTQNRNNTFRSPIKSKDNSKPVKSRNGADNSSGSDPPEGNHNKIKKEHYEDSDTHWSVFLRIFNTNCLDDICMGRANTALFKGLEDGQRRSLKKLISALRRHGDACFLRIVAIVVKFFEKFDEMDVTFQNFISLVQFVMTYVGEEVAQRNEMRRERVGDCNLQPFDERLKERRDKRDNVTTDILKDMSDIWCKYKTLRYHIWYHLTRIWPSFRNVVSAAYHYYKHRMLPDLTREMTVEEYFDLINSLLQKLKTLPQFSELTNLEQPRREVKFERYIMIYRRRLRIVVKVQGDEIELSSCYFLTVGIAGDLDGDEYFDGKKLILIRKKEKKKK